MGFGEGKDKDTESLHSRKLYRQGSLGAVSQVSQDGVELNALGEGGKMLSSSTASSIGSARLRQRTPSGKSVRSRKASRAEYHDDLKPIIRHGLTRNLLFLSLIILLGNSFLFGYNIGVLNQPTTLIQEFYNETYTNRSGVVLDDYTLTFIWSLTTAMFLPGGMIGAFTVGFIADKYGRKKAVLLSHIPGIVGAILSCLCVVTKSPEVLMVGRFITGLNCGMATQLAPMYLAEITPFNLRGAFGTANQLFVTLGIFVGNLLGLRELMGTATLWPYLLLINAFPCLISAATLPFMPDSPRYLMLIKNQRDPAEKALKFLRQEEDVTADMEEMETEMNEASEEGALKDDEAYTMGKLLRTKELWLPLFIACFLQVIQQLSGINAIFFYSSSIFRNANVPLPSIQYCVLGTSAVNVLMTLVAVPIMDVAGRRPLLLYPMGVMVIILAIITAALNLDHVPGMSYLSIGCIMAYVICFALGLGPIPMMIGAELFRQGPRPFAMSLAGLTNWTFTLIVGLTFELIQKAIAEYTFLIFLIFMVIFVLFVFFKVPETKNKTFEEIASIFQRGTDIEVEEIVEDDDVFGDEDSQLMDKNGIMQRQDSGDDHDLVTVDFKSRGSEDRQSLTKSQEKIAYS